MQGDNGHIVKSLPTDSLIKLTMCTPSLDESIAWQRKLIKQIRDRLIIVAPRLTPWQVTHALVSCSGFDGKVVDALFARIQTFGRIAQAKEHAGVEVKHPKPEQNPQRRNICEIIIKTINYCRKINKKIMKIKIKLMEKIYFN